MNDEFDDLQPVETGLAGLTVTVTQRDAVENGGPITWHDAVEDGGPAADPIAADTASQPTVAVTPVPADDPGPARALSKAATPMPDGWDLHKVAALVSDVAQNMYELPYILKKHGLTARQYETLQKNTFFQRALEAETITWTGANSIQKRLMLEAAIASEAAMPSLAARLQSKTEPLGEIVALMKLFTEIAGVSGSKAANAGPQSFGERFKIVINLGGETLQKDASPVMKVIEQAGADG